MEEPRAGPLLVVDDDATFREFVSTVVQEAGYRTVEAASGEEALDVARASEPSAIVLDVHLPGLSGHEVCSQLRARPGGVLQRAGHTEAAVDLVRLGGGRPVAVICEILSEAAQTPVHPARLAR